MLPKKTKYAIKALTYLAREHGKGPVLISAIAEGEHIPKKFLEAILLEMRNAGILASKKGAGGGYYLLLEPSEIPLSKIIRLTGGPIAMLPCASLNFYQPCDDCETEALCGLRQVIMEVRDETLKILTETTIANVLESEKKLARSKKGK